MAPRGRHWFALWLLVFLGVLVWVVARQTASVVLAAELVDVRTTRSSLETTRAELVRRVRTASSRAVLIPRARGLGLRLPADSEIVILQVPDPEVR